MESLRSLTVSMALLVMLAGTLPLNARAADIGYVTVDEARWQARRHKLFIKAHGAVASTRSERIVVEVQNADNGQRLFSKRRSLEDDGEWQLERGQRLAEDVAPPCRVKVIAGGISAELAVSNRPASCDAAPNQAPVADAGADQQLTLTSGQTQLAVTLDGSASSDPDGSIAAYLWQGSPNPTDVANPTLNLTEGVYTFSLQVRDNQGALSNLDTVQVSITTTPSTAGKSINSTSSNRLDLTVPVGEQPFAGDGAHTLLAANDLGMHCADLDYQVFSILPPFNVIHAQVIRKGTGSAKPRLLDDSDVEVVYSATANPNDPALASAPVAPVFKSNFWADPDGDGRSIGYDTYAPLYYGLLEPGDIASLDHGLPVPDSILLRGCLEDYLAGAEGPEGPRAKCGLGQQRMPGADAPYASNEPVLFDRYDRHFNFFNELLAGVGLGGIINDTNWFAADGVPVLPVDDSGRSNSYPMMRVQARSKTSGAVLASSDIVVPVAAEADCQVCHAPSWTAPSSIPARTAASRASTAPRSR